jgi:hypothetical protein
MKRKIDDERRLSRVASLDVEATKQLAWQIRPTPLFARFEDAQKGVACPL